MNRVLVIGDCHIPFERFDYLEFCQRIYKEFDCNVVVHVGDLVDNHAISYHEHDPDGSSPADEMERADKALKEWFKVFPKVLLCKGNHDRMVDRKAKTVGLPSRAFRAFREIWNLPRGWKDDFRHEIDGVQYLHGEGYSGDLAHLKAAYDNRMPTVIGHLHSVCGIDYSANERDCIWGMSVGCGVDRDSYAMAYGKTHKRKPILACGLVEYTKHGANPRLFTMDL